MQVQLHSSQAEQLPVIAGLHSKTFVAALNFN